MRSGREAWERKRADVAMMIARSGMFAIDGQGIDGMLHIALGDLCFLDGREEETAAVKRRFGDRYGEYGITGAFKAVFDGDCPYTAEVASVYAEELYRLGYLEVGRTLSGPEWPRLRSSLRELYEEVDVRRADVEAEFGEPSLVVDKRVYCYVPQRVGAPNGGWVFFDFWEDHVQAYQPGKGSYDDVTSWRDPLLRDVRQPAERFEDALVLTLYGKVLRWGPGWWVDHPARRTTTPPGVAAQLAAIHAADPSHSLRPRRP